MNKIRKVMEEFREDKLHSGSKKGPEVKKRSQAVAIALSEAKKSRGVSDREASKHIRDSKRADDRESDRLHKSAEKDR